tara:strand:- start:84 stop:515 length:432 start_codon:yes stop_codon:yes gene_type:complete
MKKVLLVALSACFFGCASNKASIAFENGIKVSKRSARTSWMNHLGANNPKLYAAILKAVMLSEKFDKEVFITKIQLGEQFIYKLDKESQGADNVMSITWKTREMKFDHYNTSDGPAMSSFVEDLYIEQKAQKLYDSLKIGEFN